MLDKYGRDIRAVSPYTKRPAFNTPLALPEAGLENIFNTQSSPYNTVGSNTPLTATPTDFQQHRYTPLPNASLSNPYTSVPDENVPPVSTNEETTSGSSLYYSNLRRKESSGDYTAVNRFNYLGGYQMGATALIDIGLVKKGTKNSGLDDPKNWNDGLSKEAFLSSSQLQDSAVESYTNKNKKYLGSTYTNASESERRGLLAAAHLLGAGGAKKNMSSVDANGVSGNDYYNYFSAL